VAFRKAFLQLCFEDREACLPKYTPKRTILPANTDVSKKRTTTPGSSKAQGKQLDLPRHATVNLIEHILVYRAKILFDDYQATFLAQYRFAPLQKLHKLRIAQVTYAPLYPYKVIHCILLGRPILQSHVINIADAISFLEGIREFYHGLDNVNLF
jgi:hypothetical protein